ncbi:MULTISPECIES: hypothetical protein [Sphingomonas]|uniref:hypothetical protein n=1 Tax=Sphingomonas TaxID=13687 RepID=UPI000DEF6352|nr:MULTISPECIES: hypothetical protein [Sphingomonas]
MTVASHVTVFLAIIVALAVGDLATSFHRLMTARARVRWYWPVLVLAAFVLAMLLESYWVDFSIYSDERSLTIAAFFPDVMIRILVFLMAAAILPDSLPRGTVDLRGHYWMQARYFWSLMLLAYAAIFLVFAPRTTEQGVTVISFLEQWWGNILTMAAAAIMIFSRREWLHKLLILMIAAIAIDNFYGQAIG